MSLGKLFTRYRHRKGFGIHSPFAFSLIGDIAGAPGHYYGDETLRERIGNRRGRERRTAWLLNRIVARLDPAVTWIMAELPDSLTTAIRIARTDREPLRCVPKPLPDRLMTVAKADTLLSQPELISKLVEVSGAIFFITGEKKSIEEVAGILRVQMPGGWGLIDTHVALFISSCDTPYIEYDVKLL